MCPHSLLRRLRLHVVNEPELSRRREIHVDWQSDAFDLAKTLEDVSYFLLRRLFTQAAQIHGLGLRVSPLSGASRELDRRDPSVYRGVLLLHCLLGRLSSRVVEERRESETFGFAVRIRDEVYGLQAHGVGLERLLERGAGLRRGEPSEEQTVLRLRRLNPKRVAVKDKTLHACLCGLGLIRRGEENEAELPLDPVLAPRYPALNHLPEAIKSLGELMLVRVHGQVAYENFRAMSRQV